MDEGEKEKCTLTWTWTHGYRDRCKDRVKRKSVHWLQLIHMVINEDN